MHIAVPRAELERAVSLVARAASTKNTIPVLGGIYLEASDGLILRATDMAQGMKTSIACDVKETGALVIPAKSLVELVHKVEGETIDMLTNSKGMVELRCGKSKHTLPSFPGDQFPSEPDVRSAVTLTIDQSALRHLIDRTAFAALPNSEEVKITCVRLELLKDRLIASASDRAIVAQTSISVDNADERFTVMAPATALKEVARLLSPDEGKTAILRVTDRSLTIDANKIVFTTLLVAGDPLPNFDRFVPLQYATTITANRSELAGAVDRAASVHTSVQFNLMDTGSGGKLILEAQSDNGATALEEIDCMMTGEPQLLLLHGDKVLKILHALESSEIKVELAGGKGPTKWTDGDSGYYLTNPLNYR